MNEKETAILEMIRQNPFLSQLEMADSLNVSRPALANLISGLMKQGKIAGRAYILQGGNEIHCIGGANVDRKFHLQQKAQLGTSNPSNVTESVGGVARNIGENLGRLGHQVRLFTTVGKDADWLMIEQFSRMYMNLQSVERISNQSTGSYSAVIEPSGELILAMANMNIYELLNQKYLLKHESILASASLIVIDLNCPKETVEFVREFSAMKGIPLAIIPVSSPKMNRMPDEVRGIEWLICNRDEAETYLQRTILTDEDFMTAVQSIMNLGVNHVIVTAGVSGVFAGSKQNQIMHIPALSTAKIKDVTGAGDAFVGATLHGWLEGLEFHQCVQAGIVNASKTLESPGTVRLDLTAANFKKELEEL
jgi:pseudouridine kinase